MELKKVLTFRDVFFIAVGQIIGAGVVALTGVAIGMTGPSVIFAYLASAVLVLIVTALIMMAGTTLPAVGAYYAWTARLCGGWMGSLVLALTLLASVSFSLYGSSFGLYLNPLFPVLSVNQWGILVVVLLFIGNLLGLQIAARLQMVLVLMLASALGIYAGFAVPVLDTTLLSPMYPAGITGFITAVFLLKFATSGAYMVVGLSGEMIRPHKTIPLVMTAATLAVAVLYALVALASVGSSPWQEMVDQPLTVAGQKFLPGWAMTYFLIFGVGLAIVTTINAQFMQLPRTFMLASWDGLLPSWFGQLNRHGAPWIILTIMLAVGVLPLIAQMKIGEIARAASIAANLPTFFVYWAVMKIPDAYPERYAASWFYMKPAYLWILFAISQLATAVGVYFLAQDLEPLVIWVLVGWSVLSLTYYPLRKKWLARRGLDLEAQVTDARIFDG
ncbi:MAG: APC family permease [Pseudomonadota bacterium]